MTYSLDKMRVVVYVRVMADQEWEVGDLAGHGDHGEVVRVLGAPTAPRGPHAVAIVDPGSEPVGDVGETTERWLGDAEWSNL